MAICTPRGHQIPLRPSAIRHKLDWSTVLGFAIGIGSLVTGLEENGGALEDLLHLSSFVIVFGATIGATIISASPHTIRTLFHAIRCVFLDSVVDEQAEMETIRKFTVDLRSWKALAEYSTIDDDDVSAMFFVNTAAELNELTPSQIRSWALRVKRRELQVENVDNCLRFAAGAGPVFGVAGAILGLIHVMKDFNGDVGLGIARAFTATIYGIFLANFVFLPAAQKITYRLSETQRLASFALQRISGLVLPTAEGAARRKPHRMSSLDALGYLASASETGGPAIPLG